MVESNRWTLYPAPYERMPLFVRAGSIVPIGPAMEWSDEKPAEEILLLIYAGADAAFTLYEDDGLTYGYERGEYATIDIHWDDNSRLLTLGARQGDFPGMLPLRQFKVRVVDPEHPFAFDPDTDQVFCFTYDGTRRASHIMFFD